MALRLAIADGQDKHGIKTQSVYLVDKERFLIGRDEVCDWTIEDPSHHISGRHCSVILRNSEYVLQDHSTNGTFLNGSAKRIDGETIIGDGSVLRIGRFKISVAAVSDSEARSRASNSVTKPSENDARALKAAIASRRGGDPAETAANRAKISAKRDAVMTRIMPILERSSHHPCDPQPVALSASGIEKADARSSKAEPVRKEASSQPEKSSRNRAPGTGPSEAADMLRQVASAMGVDTKSIGDLDTGELLEYLGRVARRTSGDAQPDYVESRLVEESAYANSHASQMAPDLASLAASAVEDALARALRKLSEAPIQSDHAAARAHAVPDVLKTDVDGRPTSATNRIPAELAPVALELLTRDREREIGRRRRTRKYQLTQQSDTGACWRPAFIAALDRHFGDIRPVGR